MSLDLLATDEELLTDLMQRHKLELQVGLDADGWQVRVRGNDPAGALHEDPFTRPNLPIPMSTAMWDAAIMFCDRYGLPVS